MSWNKPTAVSQPQKKETSTIRGFVAGGIVLVLAVGVLLLFTRKGDEAPAPRKERKSGRIAAVAPAVTNKPAQAAAVPKAKPSDRLKGAKLLSTMTNANGTVTERYMLADGKTHRRYVNPPPVFSNRSDQVIAMMIGARAGQRIPPLPPMRREQLNKAFMESMLEPITVSESDKPEVAALKIAVKEMRSEVLRQIKAGDSRGVAEILQDHVEQVNHEADMRGEAISSLKKMLKDGDATFAAEYLKRVNAQLEKYGIKPISMPSESAGRNMEK